MSDPVAALADRFKDRLTNDLLVVRAGPKAGVGFELVVHRLAGAAAMFGFLELGELAGEVDVQIHEGRLQTADVDALAAALQAAVVRPV
ncbi:Hpt domain-containing protein [Phenylobacterium sp.]|jgi:HPt (histidine-containing phosphotransfer) domain-containing protein|uniref:Hpt domain-containing protein n=1 Tax=Phenylobacterium sp. TaxID=1871053 RepID=UPI002F9313C9